MLQQLHDSLSAPLFFTLIIVAAFLIGLLLGWCLWWFKSRKSTAAITEHDATLTEFNTAQTRTRQLQARLAETERIREERGQLASQPLALMATSSPATDWSTLDSVDSELAKRLDSLGVKNIEQLESLPPQQRGILEAKLATEGHQWNWDWVANWKTGVGVAGAAGLAAAAIGSRNNATNAEAAHEFSVDWSKVDGIDPKAALVLQQQGISSIADLESLPESEREVLDAKLSYEGASWDWRQLSNLKSAIAAAGSGGVAACTVGAAGNARETSWFANSPFSGKRQGDTSSVATEPDRQSWFANSAFAGGTGSNAGNGQNGLTELASAAGVVGAAGAALTGAGSNAPAQSIAGANLGAAATAHAGTTADSDASIDTSKNNVGVFKNPLGLTTMGGGHQIDWTKVDGVPTRLAAELDQLGVQDVEQLENLSPEERRKLETHMSVKGVGWDWGSLSNWKTSSAALATAAAAAASASALSAANSSSDAVQTSDGTSASGGGWAQPTHANIPPKSDRSDSTDAAAFGAATVTGFAGGAQLETNQLPVFSSVVPSVKDDLTLLDGIDGPQAMELHRMGIHNFGQLHEMPADDRMRLQNWFRKRGWSLDMDQWRIASEGNTLNPSIEDIQKKAFEIYQFRERNELGGGERTDWEQAEWELRGNPSFGYGVPHDIDDYAVSVTGVTPEARDELYRMGLYNRGQAQNLDHDSRRLLTRWFAGPRFGIDLTTAFSWLSSLKSVPDDRNFGSVFANRPDRIDDLSDINGVGPATERDLNRIGIYQFSQVAAWSQENVQAISETLNLADRIKEDSWIVQAQRLASQV